MHLHHWLAQAIAAHPDPEVAAIETRHLAAHITGLSPTAQRIHDPELEPAQIQALDALAARLHAGEPLAYLLGHQPFYGLDLKVSRATLIPRSDSEILVERALHHLRGLHAPTVIDLGTGSGALALAIATARPDARITATDQSAEALAIAQENAHAHRLTNLTFLQADWLAPFAADCADLILSNPPYIAASDPHLAALTHDHAASTAEPKTQRLVTHGTRLATRRKTARPRHLQRRLAQHRHPSRLRWPRPHHRNAKTRLTPAAVRPK